MLENLLRSLPAPDLDVGVARLRHRPLLQCCHLFCSCPFRYQKYFCVLQSYRAVAGLVEIVVEVALGGAEVGVAAALELASKVGWLICSTPVPNLFAAVLQVPGIRYH